nr:helix-turn-helix transcriptional regulator [Oxobacter pfennigii]
MGEKVSKLRNKHNMSQGDLAEKINVSRQSISKWETGASIPDLDKLVALSNLFQVSIDDLAKEDVRADKSIEDGATCQEKNTTPRRIYGTQKIIGFILIAAAIICIILAMVFAKRFLMIPTVYLLLCGCLCLLVKKYVALLIGWITFLPIAISLPYFISSSMGAIFYRSYYQNGNYFGLLISFIMWLQLLGLVWFTIKIKVFRKKEK